MKSAHKNVCRPSPLTVPRILRFRMGYRNSRKAWPSPGTTAQLSQASISTGMWAALLHTPTHLWPGTNAQHCPLTQAPQHRLCREPPPILYFTIRNISSNESCVKHHRYQKGPNSLEEYWVVVIFQKIYKKEVKLVFVFVFVFWGGVVCLFVFLESKPTSKSNDSVAKTTTILQQDQTLNCARAKPSST